MITDAAINMVKGMIDTVLGLLPTGHPFSVGGAPISAMATFFGRPWGPLAEILPFTEFFAAIAALIAWWAVCTVFRLVLWMLGWIVPAIEEARP